MGEWITSVFDCLLFNPDFIILFENLGGVEVDKPLKISAKEKVLENFCVFVVMGVAAR